MPKDTDNFWFSTFDVRLCKYQPSQQKILSAQITPMSDCFLCWGKLGFIPDSHCQYVWEPELFRILKKSSNHNLLFWRKKISSNPSKYIFFFNAPFLKSQKIRRGKFEKLPDQNLPQNHLWAFPKAFIEEFTQTLRTFFLIFSKYFFLLQEK